ncbi:hypothetical protein CRG98_022077 [Punica granatum]|uniref:Uncharacterized protein n=1 Tax=Punica granatum TaxID=22663 RepID=A0A2I0JPK8_PUNGR|nr:hypothetical protein CRG98_022077 [Punica granatum]
MRSKNSPITMGSVRLKSKSVVFSISSTSTDSGVLGGLDFGVEEGGGDGDLDLGHGGCYNG